MAGRIQISEAMPAFDINGDPDEGATLEFFVNGDVNTPKAAYTSASDANAGANPILEAEADEAGRFGELFGPDDARYTVVWKNSAGVQQERFDDVQVQGGTEGLSYIDLDTNGRFRVFGADGKVQIETGDPTGDNTGGDARIGGWESTQGDTLELDYATSTVTGDLEVNGAITEDGKPVGLLRLAGGNGAVPDIDLTAYTADGYEHFVLKLAGVTVDTNAVTLGLLGSWSAGVFATTNYRGAGTSNWAGTSGGTFSMDNITTATDRVVVADDLASGSAFNQIDVEFSARSLSVEAKARFTAYNGGSTRFERNELAGEYTSSTGLSLALRVLVSSGTYSTGAWTLYGLKGLANGQTS